MLMVIAPYLLLNVVLQLFCQSQQNNCKGKHCPLGALQAFF